MIPTCTRYSQNTSELPRLGPLINQPLWTEEPEPTVVVDLYPEQQPLQDEFLQDELKKPLVLEDSLGEFKELVQCAAETSLSSLQSLLNIELIEKSLWILCCRNQASLDLQAEIKISFSTLDPQKFDELKAKLVSCNIEEQERKFTVDNENQEVWYILPIKNLEIRYREKMWTYR